MRETLRKEQLIQRILLISMILLSILLGTIIVNASDTELLSNVDRRRKSSYRPRYDTDVIQS